MHAVQKYKNTGNRKEHIAKITNIENAIRLFFFLTLYT